MIAWHRTLRGRVTVITSLFVAMSLVVGAVAIVLIQRASLMSTTDELLVARVASIGGGVLPESELDRNEQSFFQVLDASGTVIDASPNLVGDPPVTGPGEIGFSTRTDVPVDDDRFRVLTTEIAERFVVVGENIEDVFESSEATVIALGITIPILVGVLGGLMWWTTGRVLAPVEEMRRDVESIGATNLATRLTVTSNDEIGRLGATMNNMLARLDRSAQRQRQFVGDASHELRSPLTRMRSGLDLARAGHTPVEEAVEAAIAETEKMERLVDHMLFLARSDERAQGSATTGTTPIRRIDLDEIVLSETERLNNRDRVSVDRSAVSGAQVFGDGLQLARAIRNLLDNAERYADREVAISLIEDAGWARLTVSDDGPGVPDDQGEAIFERFTRADESRSADTGGAGLGLAIVREIVERHQGTVRILGSETGARFEIRIPSAS